MPQTLSDTHHQVRDLIAETDTNSRKAAFPREADEDRRHALAEVAHAKPVLKPVLRDSLGKSLIGLDAQSF